MMTVAEEFSSLLASRFSAVGVLTAEQLQRLYEHWALLLRWNQALNLTTITELEAGVTRHYCESLFLAAHLPENAASVLDVGSGAGFPGIPAAILRPGCRFTLAESHQRKAVFLREATRDLLNVKVAAKRAEALDLGGFDWVVSRAVRWEEIVRFAPMSIGLLVCDEDATEIVRVSAFEWQPPVRLPWSARRSLVIGSRFHVEPHEEFGR